MKLIKPEFIQIPSLVLQDKTLKSSDKFLFGYIYWFTKMKNENCTASNETLGQLTGITPRSISNSLTRLKKAGFIVIKYSGDPRSSLTKRTIDSTVGYAKTVSSGNGTTQQSTVSSGNGTGVIKSSTKEEKIKRNKEELGSKRTFRTPQRTQMPDLTGDFYERFALKR